MAVQVAGRPEVVSRLMFDWKMPYDVGPIETPDDETLGLAEMETD